MFKKLLILGFIGLLSSASFAANPSGVPVVSSIAQLRTTPATQYQTVYVSQYSSTTKKGGGSFTYTGDALCSSVSPTSGDDSGVYIQGVGGCYKRNTGNLPYNVTWFGAKCGGVQVTDGVSTSASATVTSASALFKSNMTGWVAVVNKAAASNKQLVSTISTYNSTSSVTLGTTAGASSTAETISVYPDDTTAIANTITSANANKAGVSLPAGDTCGLANPGSLGSYVISGYLYLNGGKLWLGQTGPVTDTGTQVSWSSSNSGVIGPGVIDGLYQTNQAISQSSANALVFNGGDKNSVIGGIIIQNTKGRAISANTVSNMVIDNLSALNCGDFEYAPGSGDPQVGRSICVQLDSPVGHSYVTNYRTVSPAQSGLVISAFSVPANDPLGSVTVDNMYGQDCGYFCVDLEDYQGSIQLSNIYASTTTGVTLTASKIYGSYIFRSVKNIYGVNLVSKNTNSNTWSATMGGNADMWSFTDVNLTGTAALHAAAASFSMTQGRQRLILSNFAFDYMSIYLNSGDVCSTSNPQRTLFQFDGLKASHQYGGTYDFTFNPQGNASTMVYVKGSDSDLGTVEINSLGVSTTAVLYDLFRVNMEGTPTFTGATGSASYGTTTWTNPLISFTCP